MVEGGFRLHDDILKRAVQIPHHLRSGQVKNAIASFAQIAIAACIAIRSIAKVVRTAIDFDHEIGNTHEKVSDILAKARGGMPVSVSVGPSKVTSSQ